MPCLAAPLRFLNVLESDLFRPQLKKTRSDHGLLSKYHIINMQHTYILDTLYNHPIHVRKSSIPYKEF